MRYKYLIILSIAAFFAVLCSPAAVSALSIPGSADSFITLAGAPDMANTGSTLNAMPGGSSQGPVKVPEPATMLLLGLGGTAAVFMRGVGFIFKTDITGRKNAK